MSIELMPDALLSLEELRRAFRDLSMAQSRIAENEATAKWEKERADAWLAEETRADRETIVRLTGLIEGYARVESARQQATGGRKRLTWPWGRAEVRSMPPEVRRVDEEALTVWAVEHELTRQPRIPDREVAWDEVRKRALAGEAVPGVEIIPQPDRVVVVPYEDHPIQPPGEENR